MLDQLFEKINTELLTDEIKLEMSAMFESAVNIAIEQKEQELEESNRTEINEFKDNLTTKLDEYLTYFVEEFTSENEQQIEDSVKVKTAENVLSVFEGIVSDFNMKLSDEVVSDTTELEEAKATINEQAEELIAARKVYNNLIAENVVKEIEQSFDVDTDVEKFRTVAESIEFNGDADEYKSKLGVLAESIVSESDSTDTGDRLDEETDDVDLDDETPSRMTNYLAQL